MIIDKLGSVMQRHRMIALLSFEKENVESVAVLPVRDIPLSQMQQWIADDEEEAAVFWDTATIL